MKKKKIKNSQIECGARITDLGFQSWEGKKEAKTGAFKPTLLTSRIERPTADPKQGIAITYYTRDTNFRRPPLAELGVGAA